MVFCARCGGEVEEGARFCGVCGAAVVWRRAAGGRVCVGDWGGDAGGAGAGGGRVFGAHREGWEVRRRVEVFLRAGDTAAALRVVEGFVDRHPDDAGGRELKAKVLARAGDVRGAWREYRIYSALRGRHSRELLWEMVRGALRDQKWFVRQAAAWVLGELGAKEGVPDLRAALRDQDSDVRQAAAEALGKLGAKEAVPDLRAALRDQDTLVRWAAAEALGAIAGRLPEPESRELLELPGELLELPGEDLRLLVEIIAGLLRTVSE